MATSRRDFLGRSLVWTLSTTWVGASLDAWGQAAPMLLNYQGRLTDLMRSGKLFQDIGLPPINPQDDRVMICGSPSMLDETSEVLNEFGLKVSQRMREPGDYLIERAFVEK